MSKYSIKLDIKKSSSFVSNITIFNKKMYRSKYLPDNFKIYKCGIFCMFTALLGVFTQHDYEKLNEYEKYFKYIESQILKKMRSNDARTTTNKNKNRAS